MLFSAPPSTPPGKQNLFSYPLIFPFYLKYYITLSKQLSSLTFCRSRGWARLGASQLCMGHPTAAASAYTQGLRLDPKNDEMLTGMELAKRAARSRGVNNRRAAIHDENDS
jgi:hypothetical protein